MGKINKVRINPDILDQIMKRYNITIAEFCKRIGYSREWWYCGLKHYGYNVSPSIARLICATYGIAYDKLVLPDAPETPITPEHEEQDIKKVSIFAVEELTRITESVSVMAKALSEVCEIMFKACRTNTEGNKE